MRVCSALACSLLVVATSFTPLSAQSVRVGNATVRIGGAADADGRLAAIAGAVRLPNGHIVVGNRGGDHALVVYDGAGKFVRALARKGKGPGELTYLLRLARCGPALFASDIDGERVQEFSLDLVYKRAFRFKTAPYKSACNDRGQFLHMGWEPPKSMRVGLYRADTPFWITPADSSAGVSLGNLPGSERFGVGSDGKVRGSSPSLFGREPALALGADRAYVALGDSLHILVFSTAGKAQRSVSAKHTPATPSAADVDAEIERQAAEFGENLRQHTVESLRGMPVPRSFPATRDMLVDATGVLWVQTYPSVKRKTVTWHLFRADGSALTMLELPTALQVYEVGRDYLLGGLLDDDSGMIEVRLYPITRAK